MRRILVLAALASSAGCSDPPPKLTLRVAGALAAGACTDRAPTGTVRVTARWLDGDGKTTKMCDALVGTGLASTEAFPLPVGAKVDLFAEEFDATGKQRVSVGSLLHLALGGPTVSYPILRLFPSEQPTCLPDGKLVKQRAFHSATTLPNGQVLLLGGITTRADGALDGAVPDMTGNDQFYVTSSAEIFDPYTKTFVAITDAAPSPRAFHKVGIVSATPDGRTTLVVAGGLAPVKPEMPALLSSPTAGFSPVPTASRFQLLPNATAATVEILVYDPTTTPPTLSHARSVGATADIAAALQATGQLEAGGAAGGGLLVAGGLQFPGAVATPRALLSTTDGTTVKSAMLAAPRAGAGLVTLPDAAGTTVAALLVGGTADPKNPPAPFEYLTVTAMSLGATAAMGSAAVPLYFMPTLTLLDGPAAAAKRVLISGGLGVPASGIANQPPDVTMQVVTAMPGGALPVVQLAHKAGALRPRCMASGAPYKPVAFDAATLLPSGDRVLSTGGTPHSDCAGDCEGGEMGTTCALAQSVIVTVSPTDPSVIVPAQPLQIARFGHTQSILPDGMVLIAGGLTRKSNVTMPVVDVEVWNPARTTPPATDVDDPVHADLVKAGLSRQPGALATNGSGATAIPCAVPTK